MRRRLAALAIALVLPVPGLAAEVTVQPGETLSQIADRHGISMGRLMKLNGISDPDHVEAGSKLTLPDSAGSGSGRGKGSGSWSRAATTKVTVKDGETLSEIADRYGMSVNELMRLNDLSNANHVETGSTLRVKGSAVASSSSADGPSTYRKGAGEHVVKPGESLSHIAEGYGVPMSRLVAINGLQDPDHVEVGMHLKLKGNPSTNATPVAPSHHNSPAPQAVTPTPQAIAPTATAPVVAAPIAAAPRTVAMPQAQPASGTPTMANPMAARPVVATPVVARPVVSNPVVANPVVSNPAPQSTIARSSSQAPVRSVLPAEATSRTDWRPYGPLQVDWANWQPMGGSLVAPTISGKGETLYLAINCSARKMNATNSNGDWKTWDDPRAAFEVKLVNDRCRQGRI